MEPPTTPAPSLRHGVRSGLIWTTASAALRFALQLGVSIMLARLLTPSDFGRVSMVAAFMAVLTPIASASLSQAVIAGQDDSREYLSSLYWISVGLGCTVGLAFCVSAPLIGLYYEDEALVPLARAMAASFALSGIGLVPEGLLRKRLAFSVVTRVEITITTASAGCAVALAALGFGVWSLVAQAVVQSLLAALLWSLASGFRPALVLQPSKARTSLHFGGSLSLTDIVSYVANSAHTFVLGRMLGANAMGLYSRAVGISQLLQQHVGTLTGNVMFPALASVRDRATIKSATLKATAGTALITAPIAAGLATTGDLVVTVLYGEQWHLAALPLRVLAVALFIHVALFPIATLYRALQRTDLLLRVAIPAAVFSVLSAVAGCLLGGLNVVAWLQLLYSAIMIIPHVFVAGRLVGMSMGDVLRCVASPVACAVGMGLAVWLGRALLPDMAPAFELGIAVALGVTAYGGLVFGLRIAPLRYALSLLGRDDAKVT